MSLAKKIIEYLGGYQNIKSVTSCMTRVRPDIIDPSKVNATELKKLEGVLQIINSNKSNIMIVLGPKKAEETAREMNDLMKNHNPNNHSSLNENTAIIKKRETTSVFKIISSIFAPLIPLLAGSGLLLGIYNIVLVIVKATGQTYILDSPILLVFNTIASMFFYLLNVAVAMSACEVAGGNKYLGLVVGGIISFVGTFLGAANPVMFIMNGKEIRLFEDGRGGVFAAIFAGLSIGYLDVWLRKRLPSSLTVNIAPLISILIVSLFTLFLIQPVAGFVSYGVGVAFSWLMSLAIPLGNSYSWRFGYLFISALYLPLVMLGVHHAIKPIELDLIKKYKSSSLTTATAMAGMGQIGVACGLLLRYRKEVSPRLKQNIIRALPVSILGIGEPMIYGVTLPLGKSFVFCSLGALFGGAALGFFPSFGAVTTDCNTIFGLFVDINPLAYFVGISVSTFMGFLFAFIFGVNKNVLRDYEYVNLSKENLLHLPFAISSPYLGKIIKTENNLSYILKIKSKKSFKLRAPISGEITYFNSDDYSIILKNNIGYEVKISPLFPKSSSVKLLKKINNYIVEGKNLLSFKSDEKNDIDIKVEVLPSTLIKNTSKISIEEIDKRNKDIDIFVINPFEKNFKLEICSPSDGEIRPITEMGDKIFSKKKLGNGFYIIPKNNLLVSPVDGEIIDIAQNNSFMKILAKNNIEIVVYFGSNSLTLSNDYFITKKKKGDIVHLGDPIMLINYQKLKDDGHSINTPVLVSNYEAFPKNSFHINNISKEVKMKDSIATFEIK